MCLLVGHAAAQAAQPTRKSIMKPPQPVIEDVKECTFNTVTATTAICSGITVAFYRCAESLRLFYKKPSVDAALQMMTRATVHFHADLKTTSEAAPEVPLFLSSQPGAAVVVLSLMPFGYVCGKNYLNEST